MSDTEALRREGFQRPSPNGGPKFAEPPPVVPPQPQAPISGQSGPQEPLAPGFSEPLPPLPSQMKLEQPPPEPALNEHDEARRQIRDSAEEWPITVALLYKPIKDPSGKEIWELKFRQPRAAEINRIGNPTRMLWDNEIVIEERKMTFIMASLSGILAPFLEDMDPRDWNTCALRLRKFFLPDLRGW